MSDQQTTSPGMTVDELAAKLGGTVVGDGARRLSGCATLATARPDQASFVSNPKYMSQLETTDAGCVVVGQDVKLDRIPRGDKPPLTAIVVKDAYFGHRQAIVHLHGFRQHAKTGVSPQAYVHPTAKLGSNVHIHPLACIAENVVIGDNTVIYPHVSVMRDAVIGNDCILYPSVTIYDRCVLGNRVIVGAGAVIGSDGYGFATHQGVHHRIPHIGNAVLEDDVEVGSNCVVERAQLDKTLVGKGTKLGPQTIVGHNCQLGVHNLIVSQAGIAGSTTTGKYVVLAGQVGVAGHVHLGDMARVAAQSGVMGDLEPNQDYAGTPAMEHKTARRVYLQFTQLPELAKTVRELEREIKKLKEAAEKQG